MHRKINSSFPWNMPLLNSYSLCFSLRLKESDDICAYPDSRALADCFFNDTNNFQTSNAGMSIDDLWALIKRGFASVGAQPLL